MEPVAKGPTGAFDPVIHPTHRLRICAALEPWDDYEFSALRGVVGVSDSVLSKQLAVLLDAQYVTQTRALRDGRQRVSLRLTDLGRAAFRGHVRALREIVGSFDDAAARKAPDGDIPTTRVTSAREAGRPTAVGAQGT